jgi:hypothetical protein
MSRYSRRPRAHARALVRFCLTDLRVVHRLKALRGPRESYSDVIPRLAGSGEPPQERNTAVNHDLAAAKLWITCGAGRRGGCLPITADPHQRPLSKGGGFAS